MNAPVAPPGNTPPTTPPGRNMAGRQLGRYEVLAQLATGGMAAIYVARAQGVAGFQRLVAIKVLHPHLAYEEEFISMFLDEARLAARIRHPNVVPTLDISDSEGDGYFLVMEYIEGDHLGALLGHAAKKGERLPRSLVLRVIIDALQGLAAAHQLRDETGMPLKLVHRDVSPHNVLIGTDGVTRLTDFGVAKAEVRMASTRAGQFKGKLSYMAPEQASSGSTDQRSDLFSMGIILWESLTGRRLFKGETNAATLQKIINEPIPRASQLFPDLSGYDAVVGKALARNPDERFQSAEEFIEALEAVGVDEVGSAREVASAVKSLAREKLQREVEAIQTAMDHLGRVEIGDAAPLPSDGISGPRLPDYSDTPTGLHPSSRAPGKDDLSLLHVTVAVLFVMVVLLGSWLAMRIYDDSATQPTPNVVAPKPPASETPAALPAADGIEDEAPGEDGTGQVADELPTPVGEETPAATADSAKPEPAPPATKSPRRRSRTATSAPRRRAAPAKPVAPAPSTAEKPAAPPAKKPEPAAPKPDPEPEIDLRNPYRN